jgi:hypothetical protein
VDITSRQLQTAQINDLSKKITQVEQEIEDLYREYAG